jgi:hypothetical protein
MMDEWIMTLLIIVGMVLLSIVIFSVLVQICKFVLIKLKSSESLKNSRLFNPLEYFPEEEISTIRQVFYLVIIVLIVVDILYSVVGWHENLIIFSVFDILLSLLFAINVKWGSLKNKILLFGLIPLGSLGVLYLGEYYVIIDAIHLITLAYFIKVYFNKFVEYTETNSLGITIILLFSIVFISFLFTIVVEDVSPLDSIVMVTNAFTSNSFDAAGNSIVGKLDSMILAWGGFILSGVGTATLSASIIQRYVDRDFDNLEKLIKDKKKEK